MGCTSIDVYPEIEEFVIYVNLTYERLVKDMIVSPEAYRLALEYIRSKNYPLGDDAERSVSTHLGFVSMQLTADPGHTDTMTAVFEKPSLGQSECSRAFSPKVRAVLRLRGNMGLLDNFKKEQDELQKDM